MSSGISGLSTSQSSLGTQRKQGKQDFSDLATALQSGNLSGAQAAFTAFQHDLDQATQQQNSQAQGVSSTQSSTMKQDMQSLSTALQSGNTASAQSAFSTLQQDLQASQQLTADGHHHHHHHSASDSQSSSTSSGTVQSISGASA